MYRELVDLLKCPCCGADLRLTDVRKEAREVIEGTLICGTGHRFGIVEGVADFGSSEQTDANSWSEYYREMRYDELDAAIDSRKTDRQKQTERDFLNGITAETAKLEQGVLLDVASGRGMLLRRLLQTAKPSVHIVATDLSFEVLACDRIKLKSVNPDIRVSYVACDATALPFRDRSIDMVCSFAGFMNMMNLMENGIAEAARVLKPGRCLIDSVMYMEEASDGYREVREILSGNGMETVADHLLRDRLLDLYSRYFGAVSDRTVYEGIGEKAEGDLLPYEGAWYAQSVIRAEKA